MREGGRICGTLQYMDSRLSCSDELRIWKCSSRTLHFMSSKAVQSTSNNFKIKSIFLLLFHSNITCEKMYKVLSHLDL